MNNVSEFKARKRVTFEYTPGENGNDDGRIHQDAGEELDRLAQEEYARNPALGYQRALEIVMRRNPKLAAEYQPPNPE